LAVGFDVPLGVAEAAFFVTASVALYSYLGYPLFISLAAWLKPAPPVRKSDWTPSVSLILVVHNEERLIEAKLLNCLALDYPRELIEILVISDGSTDQTEEIARRFASRGIRLVSLPGPHGKPSALNAGIPLSRGEILVLTDARQELAHDAVRALVANFSDLSVGAVSGELHLRVPSGPAAASGVGSYWNYEKLIRRMESRFDSTVGVTGALYALRKGLFRTVDPRLILDDVAIPMEAVLAGYRVIFEPLARASDLISTDAIVEYRRKVRTLAGNYQLLALRPSLLDPRRNRLLWQLLSHKISRLAVPWCLLILFASSALLSTRGGLYRALFAGQVIFYLLAFLGLLMAHLRLRLRVLSVPYAFALLNVAAANGLIRFLRGIDSPTWRKTSW
jgi:biofilm PGA synthesis N-glycosyltransferase PgaC